MNLLGDVEALVQLLVEPEEYVARQVPVEHLHSVGTIQLVHECHWFRHKKIIASFS